MILLVANLGSTRFKFRLFDMSDERHLALVGGDEIAAPDHGTATAACLERLTDPEQGCLRTVGDVAAIGFKAVHGGRVTGVRRVDDDVLAAMAEMNAICPAHNPPYIAAMRQLRERMPELPLAAAF